MLLYGDGDGDDDVDGDGDGDGDGDEPYPVQLQTGWIWVDDYDSDTKLVYVSNLKPVQFHSSKSIQLQFQYEVCITNLNRFNFIVDEYEQLIKVEIQSWY